MSLENISCDNPQSDIEKLQPSIAELRPSMERNDGSREIYGSLGLIGGIYIYNII